MTSRKRYAKIVIPTPDALLCRGPNLFSQKPEKREKKGKMLVAVPHSTYMLIRRREYERIIGYAPELRSVFERNRDRLLDMIEDGDLRRGQQADLGQHVDVLFLEDDVPENGEMDLVGLMQRAQKILSERGMKGRIQMQAVLKDARTELTYNGIPHEVPKYRGLGPEICKKFLTGIDNITDEARFKAFTEAIDFEEWTIEEPEQEMDDDYRQFAGMPEEPKKERSYHIPAEAFKELMGVNPMPNQFLVLTEYSDDEKTCKQTAFRLKYGSKRLCKVDLEGLTQKISHIWRPAYALDLRQKLALDLLLDPSVKVVYLIGGEQTGKTSIAMAAFEADVFGRGIMTRDRKDYIDTHINLIRSGLDERVYSERELLDIYDSFAKTFRDQEIGLLPFSEMTKSIIERAQEYSKVPSKADDDTHRRDKDAVLIPRTAPFELLSPSRTRGMTFTGYTIRDEAQNELPHVMHASFRRRGPGARYAIIGDVYKQIDRPGLDKYWNGLLLSMYKNMGLPHVGGIELTKCWSAVDDLPEDI